MYTPSWRWFNTRHDVSATHTRRGSDITKLHHQQCVTYMISARYQLDPCNIPLGPINKSAGRFIRFIIEPQKLTHPRASGQDGRMTYLWVRRKSLASVVTSEQRKTTRAATLVTLRISSHRIIEIS